MSCGIVNKAIGDVVEGDSRMERLPSGHFNLLPGWAHRAGKRSLGNLEVGGKLPDACKVDLSCLQGPTQLAHICQYLKPREGMFDGIGTLSNSRAN